MKILIVSNLYYPTIFGGAEMSVQKVAESLLTGGHAVVVATLNPKGRYEVAEVNGVRVHYLPNRNIYFFGLPKKRSTASKLLWHGVDTYNPLVAALLGKVLDAERPDVVNTHNLAGFSISVWGAVKKRGLPLVHTVRDHYLLCPRSMFSHGRICQAQCTACRIYGWPRQKQSRLVDAVIGITQNVLDRACHHGCFPEAERMVVYNAFEPQTDNGAHRNGGNGTVHFGYIGRLHPSKGVEVLIRSFLELPDGQAKLLIAGRGTSEYEDSLHSLISGHPAIRMLGFVEPSEFFSQVDVSVVPSLWAEPAGRVVLESMGHRIPVIGSCCGGIAEQMGNGTGWVFDPDDPGGLTRALQCAIESRDGFAAIGERANKRIGHFSTEAMLRGYLRAFSCAIEKNS